MNQPNRNVKPSHPPPNPPIKPCQQAKTGPRKGPLLRAVDKIQNLTPISIMRQVNEEFSRKLKIPPTMPNSNWSSHEMPRPPSIPVTPSSPPPAYAYLTNMPPIKPMLGPKPGDLEEIQTFFGIRASLDVEAARRLAFSTNIEGSTPLHQAARESREKVVAALIRMGASINARDALGFTPVHKAAAAGSVLVLKLLKLAGADMQAEGNQGYRPLHRAAMNGAAEAVRWLVEQGAAVDEAIAGGWTALHLAVWWEREPVVRCLLALGASVNYMNDHGLTPLNVAVSCRYQDLASILVNYGGVVE